ncbi:methyltransferase domain-containing protein [Streptomyces sp. NBC_00144]|uniref:class I SAM-dependent methyltransferase n=1 Tax=Streptomyces sp. NBC_00144 TaxID=2975665 RepID=UPI003245E297
MHDSTHNAQSPAEAARFWDNLYRGKDAVWKGDPNPVLAETAAQLSPPGRALDLGCGGGGDTVWLATHGWHVTAVDIAPTALQRLTQHAAHAGVTDRVSPSSTTSPKPSPPEHSTSSAPSTSRPPTTSPAPTSCARLPTPSPPADSSSSSTTALCAPGPGTPTPTPVSPAPKKSSTNSPWAPPGSPLSA